jgi:hypothetical protein
VQCFGMRAGWDVGFDIVGGGNLTEFADQKFQGGAPPPHVDVFNENSYNLASVQGHLCSPTVPKGVLQKAPSEPV